MSGVIHSVARTAVVLGVLMLVAAAQPTDAWAATWASAYPWGTTRVSPSTVSVDLVGSAKLNASTAKMTVGGTALKAYLTNVGPSSGHWVATETQDPVTGVWKVTWAWVADAPGTSKATICCYPPKMSDGTKAVTVTVKDVNGATLSYGWSFTLAAPPLFGSPVPPAGARVLTSTPAISVPVSDNTGVTSVSATVNGANAIATLLSGKVMITGFVLSADGPVTVAVRADDAAGNTATKTWTFALSHYENLTCHNPSCHGTTYDNDNAMGPDCLSCHIGVSHAAVHNASPAPREITISSVSFGTHTCSECHSPLNLVTLHAGVCATCHPSPTNTVTGIWSGGCVQGGCHTATSSAPMHASIDASHAFPAQRADCLAAGCHSANSTKPFAGKSIAELHSQATTTVAGTVRTSCQICHDTGVTPTSDCLSSGCHPDRALPHGFDPVKHTAVPTSPESGTWSYVDSTVNLGGVYFNAPYQYSIACAGCHGLQIADEHAKPTASSASAGCTNCHPTPAAALNPWDKSCAQGGCHTVAGATKHENIAPAHAMAQADITAGCGFVSATGRRPCHYQSIVQEHNRVIGKSFVPLVNKTLSVTCDECHSSAAFAALAGNWDGTCSACHDGANLPNHTIAGTARADAVFAKHGPVGTNTMDAHGWIRANDANAAYNTGGCAVPPCHSQAYTGGGWPYPDNAKNCIDCHDYEAPTHAGAPAAQTYQISDISYGPYACSECHDMELGPEHVKPESFTGTEGCETCHPSPRNTLTTGWDRTTCVQGGCHTLTSSAPMHASIDASHAIPAARQADCISAGCHDATSTKPFAGKSIAELHSLATTIVAGDARTSCQICHSAGVTPTSDCLSSGCHADRALPHGYDATNHTAAPTAQSFAIGGSTYPAIACSNCHDVELGPEHAKTTSSSSAAKCGACHPSPRDTFTAWDETTCVQGGCHGLTSTAPIHEAIDADHTRLAANDACFAAGCHSDGTLAAIHAAATAAGDTRTSCMVCHAAGIPASRDCTTCHADKVVSHYDTVTHTATLGSAGFVILGSDFGVRSCSDCHSSDLAANHPPLCSTCHPVAVDETTPWTGACDAAGCHAVGTSKPMHAELDSAHLYPADKSDCTASGCHDGAATVPFVGKSLADLHSAATTTVAGDTRTSCEICHNASVTATGDCLSSGCHPERAEPHGYKPALHAANASQGLTTFFDGSAEHATVYTGPIDTAAECTMCHTMDLGSLHANNCALCHSGSAPPVNSFGAWNHSCSQGSCHATYHTLASSGHDEVFVDVGDYNNCDPCHWIVPYARVTPIAASTDLCGGCHALVGDPTPPNTTCNANTVYPYLGAQTFALTAVDLHGFGVANTYWQLDTMSGSWTNGTSVPVPAPSSGTASHTIYFYSTDNAGNTEAPKSVTVQVRPGVSPGATISATGEQLLFTVPAGVTALTVDLYGGMGGGSTGYGARLRANVAVTPGQTLALKVGRRATGATGGWGGGTGGNGYGAGATGGGGSTSVGVLNGLVLAEAGGGGGSSGTGTGGPGGAYSTSGLYGNQNGLQSTFGTHAGGGAGWTGGAYGSGVNVSGTGGTSHVAGNVYLTFAASGNTTGAGWMVLNW